MRMSADFVATPHFINGFKASLNNSRGYDTTSNFNFDEVYTPTHGATSPTASAHHIGQIYTS